MGRRWDRSDLDHGFAVHVAHKTGTIIQRFCGKQRPPLKTSFSRFPSPQNRRRALPLTP